MEKADQRPEEGIQALAERQDKLYVYADDTYAVSIAVQAPDAAGEDGTIQHIMSVIDPGA